MNIGKNKIRNILNKREGSEHKGNFGHVLLVAGSEGMTGAAILSAKGAFRSGAGLVYMYVPRSIFQVIQISVPEAICIDRAEKISLERYDSVVFGPGLGVSEEVRDMLSWLLAEFDGPMVIDADGLNVIAAYDMYSEIEASKAQLIYTPHEGEAARHIETAGKTRMERAKLLSDRLIGVSVLKGAGTIVTDGNEMWVNTTGNPGMATAGSGDVLSGILGSFCGQGYNTLDAAVCGVFIHGLAGDIAAEKGQWGIMASDFADATQQAIKLVIGE